MKTTPKTQPKLPKSFYKTAWVEIPFSFSYSDESLRALGYSESGIRAYRLRMLVEQVKLIKRRRRVDTIRLFLGRVKAPLRTFAFGHYTLGVLTAVIVLLLVSGCATTGSGSLDVKDGGFCLCVDPSSEDWCYKSNGVTTGDEDAKVPQ
jgi:hypothetical protein